MKRLQTMATLAAAGALLVVPTVGEAHKTGAQHNHGKSNGTGKSCAKKPAVNKGFVVKGTLVSYNAGAAATGDETVVLNVTKMNKHASRSGLTDSNQATPGTQWSLASATDSYTVQLSDYQAPDTPSAGDKVRVVGKVAVTRKKCANPGTSLENRYGTPNVRRVKIIDSDPDA